LNCPFDEATYTALLNGLEASEVRYSELERTKRIDAEFFQKENIAIAQVLSKHTNHSIARIAAVFDGNHFEISSKFQEYGVPYYRGQDAVSNFFIEQASPVCIDEDSFNQPYMLRSHLRKDDILLSIVGSIGSVSIVTSDSPATCSCKLAILRPKELNGFYLASFLASKYGNNQIKKFVRGAVQTGLILEDMDQINVPIPSGKFQTKIETLIKAAHQMREQSKALYTEAENLLLEELGLKDWQPSDTNVAVKSFKESFSSTGRLDAEYYQPKYDQTLAKLKTLKPTKIVPLENLLTLITNGHTPLYHDLSSGEVPFLTAEHITDFRINFNSEKRILMKHHQNELKRTQLQEGDILITIKGRIGNAAVVEHLTRASNINQDVALIRLIEDVHPYYVVGYLNSKIGKIFMNQICTGQINPFLGLGNLQTLIVPLFQRERMDSIGDRLHHKVNQAYEAAQESNRLLETAKCGVEIAIEEDEVAALRWINDCLKT